MELGATGEPTGATGSVGISRYSLFMCEDGTDFYEPYGYLQHNGFNMFTPDEGRLNARRALKIWELYSGHNMIGKHMRFEIDDSNRKIYLKVQTETSGLTGVFDGTDAL